MEGRPNRSRGGCWRRGGRGGNDSDSFGGEHRGRGRGGHHRGRGKRDHYRGRGRGGGAHAAEFHSRDQDEGDNCQEEDGRMEVFSRRKLESNWDRYEVSERQEPDDDTPTQRGTDYHVLLETAGDSFTQFRFSEEKDWEMDSSAASQMSAVFVDLPSLAQSLQQVPLHQRLNLEVELVQVSTPVELPSMTLTPKQEMPKVSTPPSVALKVLSTSQKAPVATNPALVSSSAAEPLVDDVDEELDQLLSLQKPVLDVSGNQSVSVADGRSAVPQKVCEEVKEVIEEKMEEVKDNDVTPPKSASIRQEVTEEDLEDWLDSMIS
ncbi:cell death regulator Aven [Siniperca chuatsi]|uniref:cell death regulator Aven n=1 Tax=Siniperca chuatsi TaxID=119488 RepID=UPI001CE17F0F|nr:cell death regulator Aven [Siniperca chuatsi]XP_044025227.1 cell death regulator Aven [Siniperca chuatsi]XP_044025228.1 cell death regulator Aven [Siniperca chuatsi]